MKWCVFFFGMAAGATLTEGIRALWYHTFSGPLAMLLVVLVVAALPLSIALDAEGKHPW